MGCSIFSKIICTFWKYIKDGHSLIHQIKFLKFWQYLHAGWMNSDLKKIIWTAFYKVRLAWKKMSWSRWLCWMRVRMEDYACPVKVWLGKQTALDMTPLGWLGRKISTQTKAWKKERQEPGAFVDLVFVCWAWSRQFKSLLFIFVSASSQNF